MLLELYSKRRVAVDEMEPVQELDVLPLFDGLLLYHKRFYTHLFTIKFIY